MANKLLIKRGTRAKLPTLAVGEPGFCTDTRELFVGSASGNVQYYSKEQVMSLMVDKLSLTGGDMQGGLGLGNNELSFSTQGQYGYFFQNDGTVFRITDHDDHVLLQCSYNSVPTTLDGATLATATPPQEFDLPLADGITKSSISTYNSDQFGYGYVHGALLGNIQWNTPLSPLPVVCSPAAPIEVIATFRKADGISAGCVNIGSDNIIRAFPINGEMCNAIYFDCRFKLKGG